MSPLVFTSWQAMLIRLHGFGVKIPAHLHVSCAQLSNKNRDQVIAMLKEAVDLLPVDQGTEVLLTIGYLQFKCIKE